MLALVPSESEAVDSADLEDIFESPEIDLVEAALSV